MPGVQSSILLQLGRSNAVSFINLEENVDSQPLRGGYVDAYAAIGLALDSVVKILTVSSCPNYFLPLQNKPQRESTGSGGDNISVTKGVVSRIELTQNVHGTTQLLAIQIVAAINPGNSGGPAIMGDKVAGVAFQNPSGVEHIRYADILTANAYHQDLKQKEVPANQMCHRDLESKYILAIANCKLKFCVFGLARVAFSDTLTSIIWTDYVATRSYRAPELWIFFLQGKIVIKELRTWEGSSGKLPKNNGVPWRGDSGLHDATQAGHALVGGYYDSGHNIKFHFPMSFAMTMLSWSVLEYEPKYRAAGEYEHIMDLIKWGTDYLLLTFDSNLSNIDNIYVQVGESINNNAPNDVYCWMRPEDMNYYRPIQQKSSAPELASEIAAALAAASIVFRDDPIYSRKLLAGAKTVFAFARDKSRRVPYSWNDPNIASTYSSSGYWDEYIWASTWMFLASGDVTYLSLATDSSLAHNAKADVRVVPLRILNWDNKLPGAMLLLTRVRMFLYPGYPYEELMLVYEKNLGLTMCSFLTKFKAFNFTRGGLIDLNNGQGHGLANVVNAIFLASLYEDYLTEFGASGWYCGDQFNPSGLLHEFATSQADYILGKNPLNMSYVVGFGTDFPKHVHHRGASIPHNIAGNYSCTGGWEWRDSPNPNPNVITGAMVGGPNAHDQFEDIRQNSSSTEPTLAGNAGLAAALVSLTSTGGSRMDKNAIFSRIGSLTPNPPPPPPPWIP